VGLEGLAKVVLGIGAGLLVLGGIMYLLAKLGLSRIPGDFVYRGRTFTVYVPIGLMILVSVLASILMHFFFRR
jgi:multisubunit Na+/H+ antiporter MnhG subunit